MVAQFETPATAYGPALQKVLAASPPSKEKEQGLIVGVPQGRVDPYMLQIIDHLFPGHHGLGFLAKLLRQAQTKQMALPDLGLPQVADVAVIAVKNLRKLAELIGVSYDTTEKYVVVFCSLRLLWKQRDRQQITLHFPLSRPQLPEPDALDKLMDYRTKVKTFVSQVKKRLMLLHKREEAYTFTRSPQPFFANDEPRLLLEDIRRILQQEVDPERGKRLLFKIGGAIKYHCTQASSRLSAQKDDFYEDDDASVVQPHEEKSTFSSTRVDSEVTGLDQESLPFSQKGDFYEDGNANLEQTCERKSTFSTQKVASYDQSLPSAKKVDFSIQPTAQKSRLLDKNEGPDSQKGDFFDQKVDSKQGKVDFEVGGKFTNVNVIESILYINVNVKPIIEFLGTIFGEPPKKQGYYLNLHKKHQNPDAWLAATIETIVATHRPGADIKNPGGYFYSRCIACHENISPETAQLVSQYRSLTYPQLLEVLQKAPSSKAVQKPSDTQRGSVSAQKITLRIPRLPKEQQGMSHHSIKELATMIKTGAQTKNMRYLPYQQDDGSGILLVEDWVGHQRWICSLQEWQAIAHTVQRSRWPQIFATSDDACKGVN